MPASEIGQFLANSSLLILKAAGLLSPKVFLRLSRTRLLDKAWFSVTESTNLTRLLFDHFATTQNPYREKSLQNLNELFKKYQGREKAYCFVTGPSFDTYPSFSFEPDAFKVICNSIVKNDAFLEHIGGPDLLVFADPVFHFGPSRYAAAFRTEMLKVVAKYGCFVMVPEPYMPLMYGHFPELKDKLMGMPTSLGYTIPTVADFAVKGSSNILTYLMLPMAAAVADKVYILGADGRKKEEKYFWKHSKSAQFDDLMQTAFEAHPSFFRDRVYTDYYDEHCRFLENLLLHGESNGKAYYSITQSYIPALVDRQLKGNA